MCGLYVVESEHRYRMYSRKLVSNSTLNVYLLENMLLATGYFICN